MFLNRSLSECVNRRSSYGLTQLFVLIGLLVGSTGCHVLTPMPINHGPIRVAPELLAMNDKPIEFGRPVPCLDAAGWVWGIPSKLLLWDRRIDRHKFSEPTIEAAADYMEDNSLGHVKVRMNQYAPIADFRRLRNNKTVGWPFRYTLGMFALGAEALLPGRLVGGDHYNPYTQTVHLYSDVPAIALHELAHAKDFSQRSQVGWYSIAYGVFPVWAESVSSRDVMDYLYRRGDRDGLIEANRILYPAFGTYVGSTLGGIVPDQASPIYYGTVIAGHLNGRLLSRRVDAHLAEYRSMLD